MRVCVREGLMMAAEECESWPEWRCELAAAPGGLGLGAAVP